MKLLSTKWELPITQHVRFELVGRLFEAFMDATGDVHDRNHHSRSTKRSRAVPDGTLPGGTRAIPLAPHATRLWSRLSSDGLFLHAAGNRLPESPDPSEGRSG